MNMTISESDRKLLGFLIAFLIAVAFIFLVFKPLSVKTGQLDAQLKVAKTQEADMDNKASLAEDMVQKEEAVSQQMKQVLARFYPMLQSQEAERMVTILMLNHNLSVQSLTVTMPEAHADLDWYQYSENAVPLGQMTGPAEEQETLSLYMAKIVCVAEGKKEDLWGLVDDISTGYPAISISNMEWSSTEKVTGNKTVQSEEGEITEPVTVITDRLTIGLEIYMCNQ